MKHWDYDKVKLYETDQIQALRELEAEASGMERRSGFLELVVPLRVFVYVVCFCLCMLCCLVLLVGAGLGQGGLKLRNLLGMKANDYLKSLTERQLASLLYRH